MINSTTLGLATVLEGHQDLIYDLDWAKYSSVLVSCSSDFTARVWNLTKNSASPSVIKLQHSCFVYAAVFWPVRNRKLILVTGGYDGTLRLWNGQNGKKIQTIEVSVLLEVH